MLVLYSYPLYKIQYLFKFPYNIFLSLLAENARVIHQCEASKPIKSLLKDCLHLMALTWMFKYSGDFQTYAQLSPKNFEFMRKQMNTLLSKLRPIAVSIVDAFDIHDSCLLSTLGMYIVRFLMDLCNKLHK